MPMEYIFSSLRTVAAMGMYDEASLEELSDQLVQLEEYYFFVGFH